MRLFFGLELEQCTLRSIADWRDSQFFCPARPVPAANFHITLAFIGELTEARLERLCMNVDLWLDQAEIHGASLTLNRTGYWQKPGIYWLGADTWPPVLTRLAAKLNDLSCSVGSKRDRRSFQPHVTLFRRCTAAPAAPALLPSVDVSYKHFTLFESKQGKQGVRYEPVQAWLLPEQSQ